MDRDEGCDKSSVEACGRRGEGEGEGVGDSNGAKGVADLGRRECTGCESGQPSVSPTPCSSLRSSLSTASFTHSASFVSVLITSTSPAPKGISNGENIAPERVWSCAVRLCTETHQNTYIAHRKHGH